jgi:hypothetical protein
MWSSWRTATWPCAAPEELGDVKVGLADLRRLVSAKPSTGAESYHAGGHGRRAGRQAVEVFSQDQVKYTGEESLPG